MSHGCCRLVSALIFGTPLLLTAATPAAAQNGACCDEELDCIELTQSSCNGLGGAWVGPGTSCANDDCDFGACCLEEGCENLHRGECSLMEGVFHADISCGANPCGGGGILGACCAGTFCYQDTQANCEGAGRVFIGDNVPCDPNPCGGGSPNACCTGEGCTETLTQPECESIFGTYIPNTACTLTLCNLGACCLEGECQDLVQTQCNSLGGFWISTGSCFDDPCSPGACCAGPTPTSGCNLATQADCEAAGRTFLGAGTTCSPNPCGILSITAACCTSEGCEVLNEIDCANAGGLYLVSVPNCGPETCLLGACCFEEGGCIDLFPSDCAANGGTYNPAGLCFDIGCQPAVTGACCTDFGPGASCVIATQSACESGGRIYLGDNTTCDPSPCRQCQTCDGDADNDNARNGRDVGAFVTCILTSGGVPGLIPTGCECADLNHDFAVAMDDVPMLVDALLDTTGSCP